ncbi:MAG: hypothetical protein HFI34_12795 [Lachnospiraceae bacterium]|nr:hypothetical protein [Lachnospiraceae bacterium]
MRDIEITDNDDMEEDSGLDVSETELEKFRRDIYERYGEKIAVKRQNAYFSKKAAGTLSKHRDENEQEQQGGTTALQIDGADFTIRQQEQQGQGKLKTVNSRNRRKTDEDRMSSISLILGILAAIGLILFFFL